MLLPIPNAAMFMLLSGMRSCLLQSMYLVSQKSLICGQDCEQLGYSVSEAGTELRGCVVSCALFHLVLRSLMVA